MGETPTHAVLTKGFQLSIEAVRPKMNMSKTQQEKIIKFKQEIRKRQKLKKIIEQEHKVIQALANDFFQIVRSAQRRAEKNNLQV